MKYIFRNLNSPRSPAGFTLIELAVVLFIVSLLLVGLLGPLSVQVELDERRQAQEDMKDIVEALYGFAVAYGRLPCPDTDNDGRENPVGGGGGCTAAEGNVPWTDLGTRQFDPWNRRYQYRVDSAFADTTAGTLEPGVCMTAPPGGESFALCSNGTLSIVDQPAGCNAGAPGTGNTIADNIPAIVYSQGTKAVGLQPISCFEQENTNNDNVLVYQNYSSHQSATPNDPASNYYFDDLVVWISPNILKNRMVLTQRLP